MTKPERKNPKVDKNATPRWCDCRFCGKEFHDTGTFLTEVYHWLQSICDNCKGRHQAELRYEVAMGTPELAHLVDERGIVIRGFHQDEDISIDQMPRQFHEDENPLRISSRGAGNRLVGHKMKNGRPQCKDIDDLWFIKRVAQAGYGFDPVPHWRPVLFSSLCKETGYDWDLIDRKANKLAKRGLVECEDSYCWLTWKGWEWLEEQGGNNTLKR